MRRAARDRRSGGFTLFEALIATALMGLIMSALATLTAQWLPNWNRGLARVQRNEQVAVALDRLVADLSAAEYVFANRDQKQPLFDGSEFSVTFVRSAIGPNVRPGLEIVRISETADALGRVLVRTRAPFVPLPIGSVSFDTMPFADPVVLLRHPFRIAFAYAGADGNWTNFWQAANELPSAVRFVVRDAKADAEQANATGRRRP
jgi:general secretion pathway protein J